MPISTQWNPRDQLWTMTTGESFSIGEVVGLMRETDWGGCRRYLWDLRQLRRGPDSTPEIQQASGLVASGKSMWEGSRIAIVVARDFDFGIGRMFQAYVDGVGVEYHVSRDLESALTWLGPPEATSAPSRSERSPRPPSPDR